MGPRLVWIGLGNMGRGMCKNLVEKGDLSESLIIWNRTVKKAEDLQAKLTQGKSTVVASPEEAVTKGDIIFTCLGDDASVEDMYSNMTKNEVKGKLFVDCSTVHPETTEKLNKIVTARNAQFVAGPVFGAPAMAEAGQLICVLAGPEDAVNKVKPYCKGVMGRALIDFSGLPCGRATLLKVIGNTVILDMVEMLSEAHTLAEKTGIGSEPLHELIENIFGGPMAAYSKRMMSGDYYKRDEPQFGVDLARKDARHAMNIAKESGARLKFVEVADGHLADVQKHMGSKGDIAGIYGAIRQHAGLPFEVDKQ